MAELVTTSGLVIPDSAIPRLLVPESQKVRKRFIEFFTAQIRNKNTRTAYFNSTSRFFAWCESADLHLAQIEPFHVATYIERLGKLLSPPSVKQHLAAIRMLFDFLVTGQIVPFNPAASVRGPKHVVRKGKTPVLAPEDVHDLLEAIDTDTLIGLRDRAIIGTLFYSFVRASALCSMRVEDYFVQGRRSWFRFHEKGSKDHQVPTHHKAEEYLDAWLDASGLREHPKTPLFRSFRGRSQTPQEKGLDRSALLYLVKRRAKRAALKTHTTNHSFRATGITVFLANGGSIETAQQIAGHESPRTTKLYDHSGDELTLDEIERIRI